MTKEEKIKKSYEETGLKFHENVLYDNGWLRIKPTQYLSKYEFCDLLKLTDHTHSIRPKSLQGIENNNGWVKIESEQDLPKETEERWIKHNDGSILTLLATPKYLFKNCSHYQEIIIPQDPIY